MRIQVDFSFIPGLVAGKDRINRTEKFSYGKDLRRLYEIYPKNIFLLILSYCITP